MNAKSKNLWRWLIGLTIVVLLGSNFWSVAQASPPAQDPRPPVNGGGGGGGGGGGNGGGGSGGGNSGGGGGGNGGGGSGVTSNVPVNPGATGPGCAATTGQIINWGFGPQSDVVVELKTGSWRTATTSASDGNYGLGGLGVGMATLQVVLAPGEKLQPLIQDAGVYLNCNYPTVANIALFSGSRVDPPATIEMSAPSQTVAPDSNFEVTLTLKNSLSSEITNVIVTDLMPRGFTALKVDSSVDFKDAQIINGGEDGQLVVVNLDKLAAGAEAEIQLTINADVDLLNGTKIRNAATLFYRESAADQAWLDFTVGSGTLPVLTASAGTGQGAEFVPPGEAPTTGGSSTGPAAENTAGNEESASTAHEPAAASDNSVPPGDMPSTGGEIDLSVNKLNPTGLINFAEARLVVGRQADEINDFPARTSNLTIIADGSSQNKVLIVHNAAPKESSITLAASLLFLGLLVLGSGITLWRHRSDSL